MKFIQNTFNEETGESIVILANKHGRYTGKARLHPDDKDNPSRYAGFRLAEMRAWLQYYIEERRRTKIRLKAIKDLYKDILYYETHFVSRNVCRRFKLKIRDYENKIRGLNECISYIEDEIKKSIEVRDDIIKRSKGKKE